MSNRLFQGFIQQMKDTIETTIGVVDETANVIACSDSSKIGTTNEFVSMDLSDSHDIFIRMVIHTNRLVLDLSLNMLFY